MDNEVDYVINLLQKGFLKNLMHANAEIHHLIYNMIGIPKLLIAFLDAKMLNAETAFLLELILFIIIFQN